MTASRFSRYVLRTTDVPVARAFYTHILGARFWSDDIIVSPLPEQAIARGAPPHWLGYLGVDDVNATTARLVALGSVQLGSSSIFRDPFGAIVGLGPAGDVHLERVGWHTLFAVDHQRAYDTYAKLFGWTAKEARELGMEKNAHQMFAWDESGDTVGSVADISRLPKIHPQWLFFFRVASLDETTASVRAHGGGIIDVTTTAYGDRIAPCIDPQGAAFGLVESAKP